MTAYFVWLSASGRAEPQIWHDLPTDGNGKSNITPLFMVELNDEEERLTLDELVLKFKDKINDQ